MSLETLLSDDYKVDLEVFEGPLDLLLYLIRREELDIYDIPIELITRQYMEYLNVMRMLDLSIAGEFLVMASTLMMIKSRMLLPVESRDTNEDESDDWVDPRLDLVRQLVEYKKFKDAASHLQGLEALRGEVFAYGGEGPELEAEPRDASQALGDVGLFDLLTAFKAVLARTPSEPFELIEPIQWSVPDKMERILRMTRAGQTMAFNDLFNAGSHRGEVIATFLALLELLRLHQIILQQNDVFCEIMILPAECDALSQAEVESMLEEAHVEYD